MINILVTGASSDIGFAIVKKLIGQSYVDNIGLHYYSNTNMLSLVPYCNFALFKEDFSLGKSSNLVKKFLEKFKKIDVLINCAGSISNIPFEKLTSKEYDRIMNINSKVHYLITKDAFNAMKKQNSGKIINISSNVTKFGMGRNHSIHYAASKATLDILTIGLARLGAKYNILVNSVSPGFIYTKLQKDRTDLIERKKMIPLQRFGTINDVANIVEYLVSNKSNFITGQIIGVTGGE